MTNRLVKLTVGTLLALVLGGGFFAGTAGAVGEYPPTPFTPPPAAPRNDLFANAQLLSPNPTVFGVSPVAGNIRYATAERGEPNHAGFGGGAHQSVWYQWRAPRNGPVEFDTCNSNYDTELGVYTGNAVSALTAIAQDDDDNIRPPGTDNKCGTTFPLYFNSQVEFQAIAGTTYRIAVDGYFPTGFYNNSAFFLNYRYLSAN